MLTTLSVFTDVPSKPGPLGLGLSKPGQSRTNNSEIHWNAVIIIQGCHNRVICYPGTHSGCFLGALSCGVKILAVYSFVSSKSTSAMDRTYKQKNRQN